MNVSGKKCSGQRDKYAGMASMAGGELVKESIRGQGQNGHSCLEHRDVVPG